MGADPEKLLNEALLGLQSRGDAYAEFVAALGGLPTNSRTLPSTSSVRSIDQTINIDSSISVCINCSFQLLTLDRAGLSRIILSATGSIRKSRGAILGDSKVASLSGIAKELGFQKNDPTEQLVARAERSTVLWFLSRSREAARAVVPHEQQVGIAVYVSRSGESQLPFTLNQPTPRESDVTGDVWRYVVGGVAAATVFYLVARTALQRSSQGLTDGVRGDRAASPRLSLPRRYFCIGWYTGRVDAQLLKVSDGKPLSPQIVSAFDAVYRSHHVTESDLRAASEQTSPEGEEQAMYVVAIPDEDGELQRLGPEWSAHHRGYLSSRVERGSAPSIRVLRLQPASFDRLLGLS